VNIDAKRLATDRYVLDAGILAIYFGGHNPVKRFIERISDESAVGYMCEINLAEFMYNYAREFGWQAAETKARLIRTSKIQLPVIDEELTSRAARFKLQNINLFSLADCYLLAMAKSLDSTVLTTEKRLKECKEVNVLHFTFTADRKKV
jgi:predicted nucleic acid-binding protein